MKKYLLLVVLLFTMSSAFSQSGKKPAPKKQPSSADMNKMLEDAMKAEGMSKTEQEEMKKMMKDIMPELEKKPGSAIVPFTDNKKLVPARDISRINSISKKIFTDADVSTNTTLLYSKLIVKISPSEKIILTNVLSKAKSGSDLMEASMISFMQGHNQAAMGLALKAVQSQPNNVNYQNNLAAILSQSGYPEKAIPYLRKLSKQFPTNSTVLHNLGYAWFSLGEIDTARRYFAYADVRNPANPETKLLQGVIEEVKGNPVKAADKYVESFEEAPNPFTESLAKNVNAGDRLEKIDFKKLKTRITIHEYFKRGWIKIPVLADNVLNYEDNARIKNGYSKMFEELDSKLETMLEASGAEIEELANKGQAEFIKTMASESQKGVSMMSMPAVYIEKILMSEMVKWQKDYIYEYHQLTEKIRAEKIKMTKTGNNDKCPDFDKKNDDFLAYANPLLREFHAKKIEEFRVFLNAYCTWTWYIAGNPKNVVLTQCISWTTYLTGLYKEAVECQYAIAKSCVEQDDDKIADIKMPVIPNFTCPVVVSIPVGLDELQLTAETINFNDNSWNIKQAAGAVTPNGTFANGIDANDIIEAGLYGNPYHKTGNGSMSTDDMDLMPLTKILDELTPITKLPLDQLAPLDPSLLNKEKLAQRDLERIKKAAWARKILKEMTKTRCPGTLPVKKVRKERFIVGLGELEILPEEPRFVVGLGELEIEKTREEEMLEGLEMFDEDQQAWVNLTTGKKRYEPGFKEKLSADVKEALETSGLQTTMINGLEGIKAMQNFNKGLFE